MNFTSPIFWIVLFFTYIVWNVSTRGGRNEILYLLTISLLIYAIYFPIHAANIILVSYATYKLSNRNKYRYFAILLNVIHLLIYKYSQVIFPSSYFFDSPKFGIIIPVGISFYTFQNLSYIFDLNRNNAKLSKSFYDYLLYICFFPQLVAGPIVRYSFFTKQIRKKGKKNWKNFICGIERIIYGLFLKLVIANNLASFVDYNWSNGYYIENGAEWPFTLALAFSFQIFADFSGYSLIAIGIAMMFGIILPQNFRAPYISTSLGEFWQRWHRTLSRWIRDYLYIPFGGNQLKGFSMIFVLVLVMGVSGLWHGNTLSFGLWGIIHGLALVFERFVLNKVYLNIKSITLKKYWTIINFTYCLGIVTLTWILFREQNIYFALLFLRSIFCGEWCVLNLSKIFINTPILCYSIFIIVIMHYFAFMRQKRGIKRLPSNCRLLLCLFCAANCIYLSGTGSSFIYFRF